jgi:hypothetical protein
MRAGPYRQSAPACALSWWGLREVSVSVSQVNDPLQFDGDGIGDEYQTEPSSTKIGSNRIPECVGFSFLAKQTTQDFFGMLCLCRTSGLKGASDRASKQQC